MMENNKMLFINVNDFFEKANSCVCLSREEELQYAEKMLRGDVSAKEKLFLGYLPQVAAHLKRWPSRYVTLSLIYCCCKALDRAIDSFDFMQDSEKFSHRLNLYLRQSTVRHLAEWC